MCVVTGLSVIGIFEGPVLLDSMLFSFCRFLELCWVFVWGNWCFLLWLYVVMMLFSFVTLLLRRWDIGLAGSGYLLVGRRRRACPLGVFVLFIWPYSFLLVYYSFALLLLVCQTADFISPLLPNNRVIYFAPFRSLGTGVWVFLSTLNNTFLG